MALVACVLLLAGCGAPAGDGKLLDDWAPLAPAKAVMPPIGACYSAKTPQAYDITAIALPRVPCEQPHTVETYHVADYPAETAARSSPPAPGAPEARAAFAGCETAARGYLGDDWYLGRLYLVVTMATAPQWESGTRQFRCDLVEVAGPGGTVVQRTGSLRDALRGDRPIASRCYNEVASSGVAGDELSRVDCASPHDLEFTGVVEGTGDTAPIDDRALRSVAEPGCRAVLAKHLGVSGQSRLKLGWSWWGVRDADWRRGDRKIFCYAREPDDRKLVGSVRGIGEAQPRTA